MVKKVLFLYISMATKIYIYFILFYYYLFFTCVLEAAIFKKENDIT